MKNLSVPEPGASRDAGGTFTAPALALPHDTQRHKNRRVHALPGNPARVVPASLKPPERSPQQFQPLPFTTVNFICFNLYSCATFQTNI